MRQRVERQYYRLTFPPGDLATFVVDGVKMHIHEASERGIRYEPADGHAPKRGDRVAGVVILKRVDEFEVAGIMSYVQDGTFVVVLDPPGLPYSAILAEQLFLRKHYPERFGK